MLDADTEAVAYHMPRIRKIVEMLYASDVWSADEVELFYRQPLGWSPSHSSVPGIELEQSRIAFPASCNLDGTKKLPLMIIGRSQRSRSFDKKLAMSWGSNIILNRRRGWPKNCLMYGLYDSTTT